MSNDNKMVAVYFFLGSGIGGSGGGGGSLCEQANKGLFFNKPALDLGSGGCSDDKIQANQTKLQHRHILHLRSSVAIFDARHEMVK